MALYWKSLTSVTYNSSYTKSTAININADNAPPNATRLLVAHYVRGNPQIRYGINPTYGGDSMTKINGPIASTWYGYGQIGISSSAETTGEMFYLINPKTGSNDFIMYQGVQGVPTTVQNIHCILVTVTSSAGAGIELETATGSFDTSPPSLNWPAITSTASVGSWAYCAMGHDAGTIVAGATSHQSVTSSDFGNYCGYWQNYVVTSSATPITFFWKLNSTENYQLFFVSFKETWADTTTPVNFVNDELWNY